MRAGLKSVPDFGPAQICGARALRGLSPPFEVGHDNDCVTALFRSFAGVERQRRI